MISLTSHRWRLFVGRVESYQEDARRLSELLGRPPLQVSEKTALNVRQKTTPWQEQYDEATRAIVHSKFHADFVLFGYGSRFETQTNKAETKEKAEKEKAAADANLTPKQRMKLYVYRYLLKPMLHYVPPPYTRSVAVP